MTRDGARPSVEVLIVSYNTREVLGGCLRSLHTHLFSVEQVAVSVAVLDNASADRSAEVVARSFPEVRLIRSAENLGFARANNVLCATSSADYVMLLNPDVIVESDFLSPLLEELEADMSVGLVGPRLCYRSGQVQSSSERFPNLRFELARGLAGTKLETILRPVFDGQGVIRDVRRSQLVGSDEAHDTDFLWATCWLLRRSDIEKLGLFDESFSTYDEDLDYCRRLRNQNRRVVYVPSASLVHLGGASSTSSHKAQLERAGRVRYYERHRGRRVALTFRVMMAAIGGLKTMNNWRRERRSGLVSLFRNATG